MTDAVGAALLRALADRIDGAPSVARRSGGPFGSVAAYLPGDRIEGLRLLEGDALEIHVVMRWESTVDEVEREVLGTVRDLWPSDAVSLVIEDIALPEPVRPPVSRAIQ
jgi:hypothetical protein